MKLSSIVLDCSNVEELSNFYMNLLGWERKEYDHGEDGIWVVLSNKEESTTRITFQEIEDYQKPVWPEQKGEQQQMVHFDFYSDDVEKSVEHAISLGAKLAENQFGDWKVLIDPAGHPFCIVPTRIR